MFIFRKIARLFKGQVSVLLVPHSPTDTLTFRLPYWLFFGGGLLFLCLSIWSIFLIPDINDKIVYYRYMESSSSNFQNQIQKANQYLPNITSSQETIYKQLMNVFSRIGLPSSDKQTDLIVNDLMQGDSTLFLEYLEQKVRNINLYVNNFKTFFQAIPAVLPTHTHFYISSPFGWRIHPIKKKLFFHGGIDLAIMPGTPVLATGNGEIISEGPRGGYGNAVFIKHNEGYETRYGHLMRVAAGIHKGGKVSRGQVIGYVGTTGLSTGYHLHYEVRMNGEPVDPSRFFYLDKFR